MLRLCCNLCLFWAPLQWTSMQHSQVTMKSNGIWDSCPHLSVFKVDENCFTHMSTWCIGKIYSIYSMGCPNKFLLHMSCMLICLYVYLHLRLNNPINLYLGAQPKIYPWKVFFLWHVLSQLWMKRKQSPLSSALSFMAESGTGTVDGWIPAPSGM